MISLTLSTAPTESWHEIKLDETSSFSVLVRRPKLLDALRELLTNNDPNADPLAAHFQHRLQACVVDWRDVTDEAGVPIPFSWAALQSVLVRSPAALSECISLAGEAWRADEVASKKSNTPLSGSSGAVAEDVVSSTSGPASAEPAD